MALSVRHSEFVFKYSRATELWCFSCSLKLSASMFSSRSRAVLEERGFPLCAPSYTIIAPCASISLLCDATEAREVTTFLEKREGPEDSEWSLSSEVPPDLASFG